LSFRVDLVSMPLLTAFSNSGSTMLARNALILQLAHGGKEALSECITEETPSCTREDNQTALRVIKDAFADMLRAKPPSPGEFLEAVDGVRGHQMAKAAVEMLLWDYMAKVEGRPLDEVLGEPTGYAEAGISLGLGSEGEIRSRIEGALERGYKRIKVKVDKEGAFERLKAIRDAFPRIPLSADANACFELPGDLAALKRIDRFELQYLEQPLGYGDLKDHSKLAKEISTPICLDESVTSFERAEEALDSGAAKVINVKPGRVGGLTVAMKIARLARGRGAHVWVGGMLETGVGRAFNVALASQRQVDYPGDISPNDRYFETDLVKNPFGMEDGRVRPNRGAGAGVELDRDFLAKVTQKSWVIF
jgi:O-succinylbenzoate synthase